MLFYHMKDARHRIVRTSKGVKLETTYHPWGTVVGLADGSVGWSVVNSKVDQFSKAEGRKEALLRAEAGGEDPPKGHSRYAEIMESIEYMRGRLARYYKNSK